MSPASRRPALERCFPGGGLRLLLALACLLFAAALPAAEPAPGEEAAAGDDQARQQLEQMVAGLQGDLAGLANLDEHIAAAPEHYRVALQNRRDELVAQVLADMRDLAGASAALPADDPLRQQVGEQLGRQLDAVTTLMMQRVRSLSRTIDEQRTALPGLSGVDAVLAESLIQALQTRRVRYDELLVNLYTGAKRLGYPAEQLERNLLPLLRTDADVLSGRVQLAAGMLRELHARQSLGADAAELTAAYNRLQRQQQTDLGYLRTLIELLERMGQPASDYRALLAQYSRGLTFAALDKGAFEMLVERNWSLWKEMLAKRVPDLVLNILLVVAILLVFRALARLFRAGVRAACDRHGENMSTLLKDMLESLTGGAVMLFGILVVLSQLGISLGPMLAGLGVAGFIAGFALQDTLGNFAAGAMILAYRPYDVDDYIEVAGAAGFVKKMSLIATTIATFDNQTLVVPNNKIWGDVIRNVTAQKVRRVDLMFGISYRDDIEHAERILNAVLEDHEKVLSKPEWKVKLHQLGDSSVNFIVRPWVRTDDYWDVYWDITREVKLRFDREGISIPFPQRDVHLYREQP